MFKIAILISILAVSTTAESQTLTVAKKGDRAVLFNFVGLSTINLNGYQGGIGGKYFISNSLALRGLLLFGMDNKTTNGTPNLTDDYLSYGVGGGLEYHLALASSISPYVGGAFSFQNSVETTNPGANRTTSTVWGVGAIGGVEYFFNQNLSLSAEYQFGLTSTNINPAFGPKNTEFQLGFQTVELTLAAYF